MKRIERRPQAETDLLDVWMYVATEADPSVADSVLDRIDETIKLLARTPEMGRTRPELMEGIRSFPVRRHVIFITEETVDVVRVLEGSQDIPTVLLGD